ncbi:unnamed protein product [Clonostachys rosea]|uniref:Uncharacterized protein n=1 Tax=Bionectria ochroleuca TaxID=29856 RepID=A0ABY6UFM9_BIOOC|nr:unnamed protein product [Clonostachys rosea]
MHLRNHPSSHLIRRPRDDPGQNTGANVFPVRVLVCMNYSSCLLLMSCVPSPPPKQAKRQAALATSPLPPPSRPYISIVAGVIGGIAVLAFAFFIWRKCVHDRELGGHKPKGSKKDKGLGNRVREFWQPSYEPAASDDNGNSHALSSTSTGQNRDVEQATTQNTATVDRNTSVRSIMTLPAYSLAAAQNEQVIGREGERDGVDIIIEHPTQQDEEELRDQEMEALYQLRQARRQQRTEREERRRERQDARERNDQAALAEIRRRERAASNSNNSLVDELRQNIDRAKDNRKQSVSSVSYAALGVARHDGTRLRANSQESERMGLLSNAAENSATSVRSGANSPQPSLWDRRHSSVTSFDSDFPSPGYGRPRASSRASRSATPTRNSPGRASPSTSIEADLGSATMPPPEYVDVSLDEEASRSTTPMVEPPPDYPGPYRSNSQRSSRGPVANQEPGLGLGIDRNQNEDDEIGDGARTPRARGVGGVPQLPSLRISRLPEIRVEPSSGHPNRDLPEHS